VSNEVRDAALSRVHAWLGTDEQGQPNLVTDESGRYRLGPGARVDWQVFRALFARASQAAAASEPAAEAGYLERALTLVRGQFLDGRDPARYAWLATDEIEYEVTAAVADAAHRLSALRLAAGGPDRPAAGLQRRDPLARPADRRARHRPGARAARRRRRDLRPGRTG
jgi:hypothetical protein